MAVLWSLALVLALVLGGSTMPIKKVVVLMEENRSFDHQLGWLKKLNADINGLTGLESNPMYPSQPDSPVVPVTFDAEPLLGWDPGHGFIQTELQLWGSPIEVEPAPMNGFIVGNLNTSIVMKCNSQNSTPALGTAAMEFALFDHWFASIPGPTQPNRQFFFAGTTRGLAHQPTDKEIVEGYPARTIFQEFEESKLDWKIYYSDFPVCLLMRHARDFPSHLHTFFDFLDDAKKGTLPAFSWVEPRWFNFGEWMENDQHPPASNSYGEFLFKEMYEALRNSPDWNQTLFIITYDEHGGLYDHVPPPFEGVHNPDGLISPEPPFNFTRLGLRVPTVMISPWIEKGTVMHAPAAGYYDHTSTMHTLRKIFPELPQTPLTWREAYSATFEEVFSQRTTPRTDCPETLPIPVGSEAEYEKYMTAQRTKETPLNIRRMLQANPAHITESPLINDLQKEIVKIAQAVGIDSSLPKSMEEMTEYDAAVFIRKQLAAYKKKAASVTAN